jgi:hypothetical protein
MHRACEHNALLYMSKPCAICIEALLLVQLPIAKRWFLSK